MTDPPPMISRRFASTLMKVKHESSSNICACSLSPLKSDIAKSDKCAIFLCFHDTPPINVDGPKAEWESEPASFLPGAHKSKLVAYLRGVV